MKVQRKRASLAELGATAVFVAFDEPDLLRRTMLADVDLHYPFLVDRDGSTYEAWGLVRLPWHQVWLDPQVWKVYAQIIRKGGTWRGLGSDTRQMGGDFVVDAGADGTVGGDDRITYARPQVRDDRPAAGELYRHVKGLRTPGRGFQGDDPE